MKIRKNIKVAVVVAMILMMAISFAACSGGKEAERSDDATKASTGKVDATVGTDADGRKIDDQSFYGTWIADSAKAENMFDGFQITFNEDGTYDAVVTEENISGIWERDGEKVTLTDDEEILPCDYTYTAKGGLKLDYEGTHIVFHR